MFKIWLISGRRGSHSLLLGSEKQCIKGGFISFILERKAVLWIATYKRMKSDSFFTLSTKINSKYIKDLMVRVETMRLLEENRSKSS